MTRDTECARCAEAMNCINGRYCNRWEQYVEYGKAEGCVGVAETWKGDKMVAWGKEP